MTKKRCTSLVLCFVLFSSFSFAVYEDEVGVYDWALFNIGRVTGAEFATSSNQIFVITDQGAIASLHTETGELNWRQMLPNGSKADSLTLFNNDKHLLTITDHGTRIYLWRTSDGGLMWEQEIFSSDEIVSNEGFSVPQVAIVGHEVSILARNTLFLISLRSGNILWNAVRSPEGIVVGMTSKKESIYVVVQEEKHLVSYKWDTETGAFHLLVETQFPNEKRKIPTVSLREAIIFGSKKKICVFDASQSTEKFSCRAVGEITNAAVDSSASVILSAVQSDAEGQAILVSWAKGSQNNLYRYTYSTAFSKV
eukprot:CAMPEP_0117004414 /NCGR_PEP_ID=MMETSP0472-20121206/5398_1 /TAXON_ID=693140 ORGANISM="Tiarina fusus, Strain LIS" /NCGR_SAMPLE_ID=MMETSP0472 /ASSEMBLY_ACC=CAM_ASM_000603 /LENGTH=309 /DNA_ID=CAMNT_0004705367 /DNA_START=37 /DNA_END=963 /DNA_ORIENTATION=+